MLLRCSRRRLAATSACWARLAATPAASCCRQQQQHAAGHSSEAAPPPPLNTVVLLGSTREKRIGSKVGDYIVGRLEERGGHNVTVLDPRSASDGFFMQLMEKAFFHYKQDEEVPEALVETAAILRAADAYIVVTPEMNHTISPGLSNMMNYFGSSVYAKRPSGIATYSAGMWGGARCGVALRSYLSELGCLPVSATFQQAGAWKKNAFDDVSLAWPSSSLLWPALLPVCLISRCHPDTHTHTRLTPFCAESAAGGNAGSRWSGSKECN